MEHYEDYSTEQHKDYYMLTRIPKKDWKMCEEDFMEEYDRNFLKFEVINAKLKEVCDDIEKVLKVKSTKTFSDDDVCGYQLKMKSGLKIRVYYNMRNYSLGVYVVDNSFKDTNRMNNEAVVLDDIFRLHGVLM